MHFDLDPNPNSNLNPFSKFVILILILIHIVKIDGITNFNSNLRDALNFDLVPYPNSN